MRAMDLSNRLKVVGSNETDKSTRATKELKIGMANKSFADSKFTRLIDAPTVMGEYFQKDKNSSSYTERLRLLGDPNKSSFFNLIEKFVAYNVAVSEEIDNKEEEERSPIINLTDKTLVFPSGSIRPVEGDCFVLYSHNNIRKPFQIARVTEKMLIDREVYEVLFKESQMYSYDELMERVSNRYVYLESNVGSGNKVILEKDTVGIISKLQQRMLELNREYIECFYDELLDTLRVTSPLDDKTFFTIRSLSKFQLEEEVLKFGFDNSSLIINNDYVFELDDSNYNASLYKKVIKHKKFKSIDESKINGYNEMLKEDLNKMMKFVEIHENERDIESVFSQNEEMRGKYVFKFFYRSFINHMVLTRLYNSDVRLIELLEVNKNLYNLNNNNVGEDSYAIRITNPIYTDLLDKYFSANLDFDIDQLFTFIGSGKYFENLDDYSIFNYDINDYIMFPVMKYIIEKIINEKTKDKMITSY